MIKFSNWLLSRFSNIDNVYEVLNQNRLIVNEVEWDDRNLEYRINEKEGIPLEVREILVDNNNIRYIIFNVTIERQKRGWNDFESFEDKFNLYSEDVLIYQDNTNIKMIVLSTKGNAERIIKYMFPEEVWGHIDEDNQITKDVLYWVFHRLREYRNDELAEGSELYLTGLISYMGKSKDEINAVRGSGVRVSALLGTLAFIFNNENLRALRPEFQFRDHTVITEIHLDNSNKIFEKYYRGVFDELNPIERNIAILLLTCKSIIPTMIGCYNINRNNNSWSPQIKLNYLQQIGISIRETVERELDNIAEEIDRLNNNGYGEFDEEIESEEFEDELDGILG